MAGYRVSNTFGAGTPAAMTSTGKTYLALTSPATVRRGWINDILCGIYDTPDDRAILWRVNLQTTVGTGTTVTPAKLDQSDAAALLVATNNHSAEPTITADSALYEQAANMRQGVRWQAAPGSELVIPAVSGSGYGARALSPLYVGTGARVQFGFRE